MLSAGSDLTFYRAACQVVVFLFERAGAFLKVLRGVERQCMMTYGRGAVVDFFRARATLALEVVGVSSAPWKIRGLLGSDNKDAKKHRRKNY